MIDNNLLVHRILGEGSFGIVKYCRKIVKVCTCSQLNVCHALVTANGICIFFTPLYRTTLQDPNGLNMLLRLEYLEIILKTVDKNG